ncbi:hypothetical protein JCM15548_13154 [Geofilum rubicundum JCM 15548]|uniref:Uncharacterized protein n=1 Tax=Geofilum rubicundum JCM 15548 TaxID=1236989 RepID=A0A0E9M121_9BACT|nr:hypothetical protein JCM15548_13154 [Geofilum rubicundum JCM 15548]
MYGWMLAENLRLKLFNIVVKNCQHFCGFWQVFDISVNYSTDAVEFLISDAGFG